MYSVSIHGYIVYCDSLRILFDWMCTVGFTVAFYSYGPAVIATRVDLSPLVIKQLC